MIYNIGKKLKWIDVDKRHSKLVVDNSDERLIAELEFNTQISTKSHWSSFNHITRTNKDSGFCYGYDYLEERDKAKKAVVDDLIKECKTIINNSRELIEGLKALEQ
ncbi:MAG: hypothetical protein HDQ99_02975 [Lachnospiraceae bacterium]|nr:hypothetical protein [Lachnospiraceae bacterium]